MPKTALITGASRGIGRAIAIEFAKAGYQLVITCSKSEAALLDLKDFLEREYHTQILTSVGDVSSYSYIEQLFSEVAARFGGIDVLINNAGISYIGLLTDMSIEDWNHIVETNLTSVFSTCRLAIPHMVHCKQGKIINISSVWGIAGALLRGRIFCLQRWHQCLYEGTCQGAGSEQHPGKCYCLWCDRYFHECLLFRGRTNGPGRRNPCRALWKTRGGRFPCLTACNRKSISDRSDHHIRRRMALSHPHFSYYARNVFAFRVFFHIFTYEAVQC